MIARKAGTPVVPVTTALNQATWFIDPANSTGLANDSNTGLTALTPLLTEGQLYKRRMQAALITNANGYFPILQDTTVTYLSSSPAPLADPIKLYVQRTGSFNLSYIGANTTVRTDTIAAVTTTRGGVNWWRITATTTAFTAADVGRVVINTTRNTYAVIAAVAAGVASTTEWISLMTTPIRFFGFGATYPGTVSPVGGDSITVAQGTSVVNGGIKVSQLAGFPGGGLQVFRSPVSFLNFNFVNNPSGSGIIDPFQITGESAGTGFDSIGADFTQCTIASDIKLLTCTVSFINCFAQNNFHEVFGSRALFYGGLIGPTVHNASQLQYDAFVLIGGPSAGTVATIQDTNANGGSSGSQILVSQCVCFGAGTAAGLSNFLGAGASNTSYAMQDSNFNPTTITGAVVGKVGIVFVFSQINQTTIQKTSATTWTLFFALTFTTFYSNASNLTTAFLYTKATQVTGAAQIVVNPANLDNAASLNGNAIDPGSFLRFFT